MKQLRLLLLVFFLSFTHAFSQANLPAVFEIKNDTADHQELDNSYWQVLEDRGGTLTIADVTGVSASTLFHTDSSQTKGVDNSLHNYWFRVRLKNAMQKQVSISFSNLPYSEQFDLYIFRQGKDVQHRVSGVFIPYNKRDGFKDMEAIPVVLQPGEEVIIYKHIFKATQAYRAKDHLWLGFTFTDKLILDFYNSEDEALLYVILHSFTFGVLLLACLFNFFFFYINREKVYLYFASFLLFEGLVFFELLFLFFLRDYPKARAYIYPLERFAALFFLVHFIRHLLDTHRHFPKWDKTLSLLSYLPGIFTLVALLIEPLLSGKWSGILWMITTIVSALLLIVLLITLLFFKKESNKNIRIMLIAILPALCVWTLNFGFVYVTGILHDRYNDLLSTGLSTILLKWQEQLDTPIETICLCWMVIFFSWILFLRYSQLRKENEQRALDNERLAKEQEIERSRLIEQQKTDLEQQVTERTAELKQSLEELKATQQQLIHQEKMASLGELTAGIAHEIQNPLNFVNNFSDVNDELINELVEEVDKGNIDEVKSIAKDIQENEQKINHHGKRADAIVKGMLQHSKTSTGKKEPTDLNALADEYLRLSFHGVRAKDKSFNADIKTDFDASIGKINIVQQDIGRVLLNLFNNAFYAINEKSKDGLGFKKLTGLEYKPTVSVETKKLNDIIEIIVKDNGNGIPQNIVGKIFQPFFTTKPTGQGTGLGLSLAYDIITKEHNGTIKVESKAGEGSAFIIQLAV